MSYCAKLIDATFDTLSSIDEEVPPEELDNTSITVNTRYIVDLITLCHELLSELKQYDIEAYKKLMEEQRELTSFRNYEEH